MSIICKQCGYENPDGTQICEICAEVLEGGASETTTSQVAPEITVQPSPAAVVEPVPEVVDDGNEYFVLCPESQTKTILPNGNVGSFYCAGCKKNHDIDGFIWSIESRVKGQTASQTSSQVTQMQAAPAGDNLWLEEINSHTRIDIDKEGGTLGRYGKYGSDFFQSRGMLTVSGEHCRFSFQYGTWVISHISRTNQTMYNNMVLDTNAPTALEDGKVLTLANTVTFIVRIG
jgi:hypothetical protein